MEGKKRCTLVIEWKSKGEGDIKDNSGYIWSKNIRNAGT